MAMGEDMGRSTFHIYWMDHDGSTWINIPRYSKNWGKYGKVLIVGFYAVYIMHKYRVHIDTERERERPGGKWDEWG